jgi:hypothetical protein
MSATERGLAMDEQLMLGILLIVVGAAFALIAVAVVLNRRADHEIEGTPDGELTTEEIEPASAAADEGLEPEPVEELPGPIEVKDEGSQEMPEPAEELPDPTKAKDEGSEEIPEPFVESPAGELSLLAEIYRDETTGSLILKAGDEKFRTAAQIESKAQRENLAGVIKDMVSWFSTVDRPAASEKSGVPSGESMVQAIDAILQRSLESSDVSERGVRLVSDASGAVKVLIGVKSYELEQVPDEEIRGLIRQSVAEWEASQ